MRWSLGNVNKLRVKATQSEPLRDRTRRWQRQPECSRSAIASLPVDGRRRQSPSCTWPHLKQAFPVLWSGSFTHDARLVSTALDTKCGETEDRMLQWIPLARSWHLLARVGIVTIAVAAATALQLLDCHSPKCRPQLRNPTTSPLRNAFGNFISR